MLICFDENVKREQVLRLLGTSLEIISPELSTVRPERVEGLPMLRQAQHERGHVLR